MHKPPKKKVLIYIYNSNNIGGPTTAMRLLQKSFLKDEYEFQEIYIDERLGIKPNISLLKKLISQTKCYKPDIIHITGLQLHGFYAMLATRLAGFKNTLLVIRGSTRDAIEFPFYKKIFFILFIEPITLFLSKKFYTVSNAMGKRFFLKLHKNKSLGTINNAMPEIKDIEFKNGYIRNELGLTNDDILLVYTGRITKEKGLQYLLEAFNKMQTRHVKLILVGDGINLNEFKSKYNKLVGKSVYFLGRRNDILNILFDCDIFVFPTLHENLSNSLLEAISVGLPIIATNVGGNPEVVDKENGILVNPKSTIELSDAINFLTNDSLLREQLGNGSIKKGREKFSQEYIFGKIKGMYMIF